MREVARKWAVEIVAGEVQADQALQLGEGEGGLDERVYLLLDPPRLGFGRADEWTDARQHLDVIGITAEARCLPFDVGIEVLRAAQRLVGGEDRPA